MMAFERSFGFRCCSKTYIWSVVLCISFGIQIYSDPTNHRDFILCFMENDANSFAYDDTAIVVMNPTNDTVYVTIDRLLSNFILQPHKHKLIFVEGSIHHVLGTGIHDKGILVSSNGTIAVEGLNRKKGSSDLFSVRPTGLLSTEYLVVTYCNSSSTCQVAIVATENNTALVVYFPYILTILNPIGNYENYGPDRSLNVDLQHLEVYQLQSDSDFTGVIITSNNPVAVFAGANQSATNGGSFDHIVDSVPPTQAWGFEYVITGSTSNLSPDIVKIIATSDHTFVETIGCSNKTFDLTKAFDYVEDHISCGGYVIHANNELVVAQIRLKSGDNPGMFYPFPTHVYSFGYIVYVPEQKIASQTNTLFIIAGINETNYIMLNDSNVASTEFDVISGTMWAYGSLRVDSGTTVYIYNSRGVPFGGHLLVNTNHQLSVLNLIPLSHNENPPVCCKHLESKMESGTTVRIETSTSNLHETMYTNAATGTSSSSENSETTAKYGCCHCFTTVVNGTRNMLSLKELREITLINSKNTSNAIRKLTSARDDRISAMRLGYCGIAVLCTVVASIALIDMSKYLCNRAVVYPSKHNTV